ncbi:hypothetical protein VZT92_013777 [Zoarces viviparus]|uniref:Uncharacterized protein n=1 Tax=Zoarces viviparus TaxID=48416 RepID=A0AAW1F4J1_ZOAVI
MGPGSPDAFLAFKPKSRGAVQLESPPTLPPPPPPSSPCVDSSRVFGCICHMSDLCPPVFVCLQRLLVLH